MKVWLVTVYHNDGTSWTDSVYETYRQARKRADQISYRTPEFYTQPEPREVIPERTEPLK